MRSKPWIVAKGVAFLILVLSSSFLLWLESARWSTLILLAVLIWSSARFYYFLFYVLERYVDPALRYSVILALLSARCRSLTSLDDSQPRDSRLRD